jgi:crossover junction endodeoxyribonuclease RuvC
MRSVVQERTKKWRQPELRRKLVAMSEPTPSKKASCGNGCMRVLGVDPAAAGPTGYGIVESDGRHCRMVHYGALQVASRPRKEGEGRTLPVPSRSRKEGAAQALQEVHELLCRLIDKYSPDVVAVENIFSALNVRTALRLAEVRGVVLLAAAQHGLEVHSYAPREVKASVAGHGHADKRQMQIMVRALLSMAVTPEPADAADALAVALCHLQVEQARRRFGLPKEQSGAKARSLAAVAVKVAAGSRGIRAGSATRVVPSRILHMQ